MTQGPGTENMKFKQFVEEGGQGGGIFRVGPWHKALHNGTSAVADCERF